MKFRKCHRPNVDGLASRGTRLNFGSYGLMAIEGGKITSRQIEAARIAMTRHIKRGGEVRISIFPHTPITRKPAEVRMGNGKGSVDHYVAAVQAGTVLYEMKDVTADLAKQALLLAAAKLPIKTRLLIKGEDPWVI